MSDLTERAKQILYAVVTEFVATGEPVSSKIIAQKWHVEVSPATIRNVLQDLEERGYLHQPHASAGRVPTDLAFRLFVDALMKIEAVTSSDRERIEKRFRGIGPDENVLRETGRLLSDLTGAAAVVVTPKDVLTLSQLRFLRTKPGEILAVLIMSNGTVQNRFIKAQLSDIQLERIQSLLDDVTEGRTLGELREFFARKLASEQIRRDELRHAAYSLGESVVGAGSGDVDVVIEGQSRLLNQLAAGDVKEVAEALDEQQALLKLLDATMQTQGTTVVVGQETGVGGGHIAIVGAPYLEHGRPSGTVAVIGTTRMDYPKVVPIVSATAQAMSQYITKRRDENE